MIGNRLGALLVFVASMGQICGMESFNSKNPLVKKLDAQQVEEFRDYLNKREKERVSRQDFVTYAGYTAYGAAVAYFSWRVYHKWNEKPEEGPVTREEFNELNQRVLRNIPEKKVEEKLEEEKGYMQWGLDYLKGGMSNLKSAGIAGGSLLYSYVPFMIQSAFVTSGSKLLTNLLWKWPLSSKVSNASDYLFRSATLLWVLEKECNFRRVLIGLKGWMERSDELLIENNFNNNHMKNHLRVLVNSLVRDAEKILGHMHFVKDQLSPDRKSEIEDAESLINGVVFEVNSVIAKTQLFISDEHLMYQKGFLRQFIREISSAVNSIIDQMETSYNVQYSVGLYDDLEPYGVENEFQNIRKLFQPEKLIEVDEPSESEDPFQALIDKMAARYSWNANSAGQKKQLAANILKEVGERALK
ncbi:hypothetical protein H0X06_03700 [Candidatus Dependentiae bacterium]|nr:hypothetical protein [Candidatus Dependentiae bacterium]